MSEMRYHRILPISPVCERARQDRDAGELTRRGGEKDAERSVPAVMGAKGRRTCCPLLLRTRLGSEKSPHRKAGDNGFPCPKPDALELRALHLQWIQQEEGQKKGCVYYASLEGRLSRWYAAAGARALFRGVVDKGVIRCPNDVPLMTARKQKDPTDSPTVGHHQRVLYRPTEHVVKLLGFLFQKMLYDGYDGGHIVSKPVFLYLCYTGIFIEHMYQVESIL